MVVEVDGLARAYGAVEALRGVSFRIARGEIVGLLGPNGAGKSTALKILTGYVAPTAGSARVCGHDTLAEPLLARQKLGYLPENAPLWFDLDVRGLLRFVGEVRGLGGAELQRGIERVSEECGVADRLDQRIGTLSKGYRQRAGLAQALLHEPELLILDEPTTGLDPNQIVEIRELIRRLGRTRTVILSTHILPEVAVTCDRVLILHQGRVVADGPTARIVAGGSGQRLTIALADGKVKVASARVCEQLAAIAGITHAGPAAPGDAGLRVVVDADRDVRADVFRWAVVNGHVLVELTAESHNLEEVFRRLTEREAVA